MHPSRFAGAIVLAGATLLLGCEQNSRNAANTNQPVETASTQGCGRHYPSAGTRRSPDG